MKRKVQRDNFKFRKFEKGITLIALVVTIVVLLILAGVSISMLSGENGIITQANESKVATRAGNVKEEVELWKTENNIRVTTNQEKIGKEEMLQNLKDKNLVTEEEIDRDNEIIIIGKYEISYSDAENVVINIRKTPEEKISSVVFLEVISVEGLEYNTQIVSSEEYYELVTQEVAKMTDEEKEELFIELLKINNEENIEINDFDDLVEEGYLQGMYEENTKEAFYEWCGGKEAFENDIVGMCINSNYKVIGEYNSETGELKSYRIQNPEGVYQNYYIATENGDYTFIVEDMISGKKYSKTVEVTNIGENEDLMYYIGNAELYTINLLDKDTNLQTAFERAFIIYNNKLEDITELIVNNGDEYYILGWSLDNKFGSSVQGNKEFIFIKDGIVYTGFADVSWPE